MISSASGSPAHGVFQVHVAEAFCHPRIILPVVPDYSNLSLWMAAFEGDLTPRPALGGDTSVDVAIVAGGFTGLRTAYYLTERDPSLPILVIEREKCGFGASGRYGGWAVGEPAAGLGAERSPRLGRVAHGLLRR